MARTTKREGMLAGMISELSELDGWELRQVIRSTYKLRRAIRAIEKAEQRKKDMKGLKYERTK